MSILLLHHQLSPVTFYLNTRNLKLSALDLCAQYVRVTSCDKRCCSRRNVAAGTTAKPLVSTFAVSSLLAYFVNAVVLQQRKMKLLHFTGMQLRSKWRPCWRWVWSGLGAPRTRVTKAEKTIKYDSEYQDVDGRCSPCCSSCWIFGPTSTCGDETLTGYTIRTVSYLQYYTCHVTAHLSSAFLRIAVKLSLVH